MACRITASREWAVRIEQELPYFEHRAVFVTLTYDWSHVPRGDHRVLSLRKSDLQLFFKRLRKQLGKRKVKYFACGEYGGETHRPHYHAIVLGVDLDEHECRPPPGWKRPKGGWAVSGPIKDCWTLGLVVLSGVGKDSIRYVTDYMKKQVKTKRPSDHRELREPQFRLVSQGMGRRFAEANEAQLRQQLGMTVYGVQQGLPRYYRKVLDITAENTPELVKRAEFEQRKCLEGVVDKLIEGGKIPLEAARPRGATVVGRMEDVLSASRRQRDTDIRARAALRPKRGV